MAVLINNYANITYEYGGVSDSAISNVATTNLAETYSLAAEKSSNNISFRPSENLTFSVRLKNDGALPLYAVSIQNNLGSDVDKLLQYVDGSARMLRNGIFTDITPTSVEPLTFVIPDALATNETVLLTYVAKVKGDIDSNITSITNTATVVGHEVSISGPTVTVDPSPSVTIAKANYANVKISKSVDKENIVAGDTLTYTFRLENSGNVEASNVEIVDLLPENFVINSITSLTNGITTTFDATDYSLDVNNRLVLPTSVTKTISVPASTLSGNGVTIVTIVGNITA